MHPETRTFATCHGDLLPELRAHGHRQRPHHLVVDGLHNVEGDAEVVAAVVEAK